MSKKYSVTELATLLNVTLERAVQRVSLEGEISQLTRAGSGHLYFTLKDEHAQLQAVMWRGGATRLSFNPRQGDQVHCIATANVYVRSGRMQLIVHQMAPQGEGDLQKRFLALKATLEKEGLFDESRKRPLPFFPKRIGVVTSESGAVIHDIMVTLKARMPGLDVQLINVRVQGEGAKEEIAAAIESFNAMQSVDVLIVGRGGGSLEDLWAFNEERVVRAIFASRIPIVSSVGHESDTTLSDLVADVRAATPTAAAEQVVPHQRELHARLDELARRLEERDRWLLPFVQRVDSCEMQLRHHLQLYMHRFNQELQRIELRLQRIQPQHLIKQAEKDCDGYQRRLERALAMLIKQQQQTLERYEQRMKQLPARLSLSHHRDKVHFLHQALQSAVVVHLKSRRDRLTMIQSLLESMNPQRVLDRGYAIVHHQSKILRSISSVSTGDSIQIKLSNGALAATVTEKEDV